MPKKLWTKGQPSPNPNGRPRNKISLVDELKEYLRKNPYQRKKIIERWVKMAAAGDFRSINLLVERIDGKEVETHKVEGAVGVQLLFTPVEQLPPADRPRSLTETPSAEVIEGTARLLEEKQLSAPPAQ
jgi:hypothetical protein